MHELKEGISNLGVNYLDLVWVEKTLLAIEGQSRNWETVKATLLRTMNEMVRQGICTEDRLTDLRSLVDRIEAHARRSIEVLNGALAKAD